MLEKAYYSNMVLVCSKRCYCLNKFYFYLQFSLFIPWMFMSNLLESGCLAILNMFNVSIMTRTEGTETFRLKFLKCSDTM